ncbi:uncharacterized protein B4U79_16068 [Dinothrombium tinctorium]|uniref:BCL-6 corepressor PCGF1 binding domain-containing protein n=1 Tax=Dinothrombium tinctorium TaxID=1965070 RepID=A0A3S3SNQ4_9ACAR|nr:uncharacterized protein B4U79_16068 [Dinothrombium tinctorium]
MTATSTYCNNGTTVAPNPHLGLMPSLLTQQNRDSCLDVTPPSVASFMDAGTLPFHMRLNSNLGASLSSAGQRSALFNGALGPHLTGTFGSAIPHFALYSELLNDMNRRPESDKDGFSLRAPGEPTTRFSDHLQRLREQHVQQNKCAGPCCVPHVSGQLSETGCSCCNKGLACLPPKMQQSLLQTSSAEPVSRGNSGTPTTSACKDLCSHEMHRGNNGNLCNSGDCNLGNFHANKDTLITSNITHPPTENQMKISNNVPHLWNPTLSLPQPLHTSHPQLTNSLEESAKNAKSATKEELRSGSQGSSDGFSVKVESAASAAANAISKGSRASNVETNYTQSSCEVITIVEETKLKSEPHSSPTTPSLIATASIPASNSNSISFATSGNSQNANESSSISKPSQEQRVKSPEGKLQTHGLETNGIKQDPSTTSTPSTCHGNSGISSDASAFFPTSGTDASPCKAANARSNTISEISKAGDGEPESSRQVQSPKASSKERSEKPSITKQLKEYKILPKSQKLATSAAICKKPKETKTIEIQCDGPDWTPIVLPVQFKNRLLKSDVAEGKSRKRSMLDCLANSEGYVADKVKKKRQEADLIASHPSQLDREERALQVRAKPVRRAAASAYSTKLLEARGVQLALAAQWGTMGTIGMEEMLCWSSHNVHDDNPRPEPQSRSETTCVSHKAKTSERSEKSEKTKNHTHLALVSSSTSSSKRKSKKPSDKVSLSAQKKEKNESRSRDRLRPKDAQVVGKEKKKTGTKAKRKLRERLLEKMHEDDEKEEQQRKSDADESEQPTRSIGSSSNGSGRKHNTVDEVDDDASIHNDTVSEWTQKKVSDCEKNAAATHGSASGGQPSEMKRIMVNKALGETVLHRAARQGYKVRDVVMYCLATNTCDINARDNAGYTPLHECCSRGHLAIAKALLAHGGDVNASAAGGIRPLHDAVEGDHLELVRLLLSYGADPTISTYSGLTPLKLARSKAMVQFLKGAFIALAALIRSPLSLGFLFDLTAELPSDSEQAVLPWKFKDSLSVFDSSVGFDVFDGLPSDCEEEESDEFLFEVSDSPHLPCFRLSLPGSRTKAYCNSVRLSDVLRHTALSREEFSSRHQHISVLTLSRHEFESSASCSHLMGAVVGADEAGDGQSVELLVLDDMVRELLGVETIRLR